MTYCKDPETSAIKSNTVNSRQVTQDPPVQEHARIIVDKVGGGEAMCSHQLPPTKNFNCVKSGVNYTVVTTGT